VAHVLEWSWERSIDEHGHGLPIRCVCKMCVCLFASRNSGRNHGKVCFGEDAEPELTQSFLTNHCAATSEIESAQWNDLSAPISYSSALSRRVLTSASDHCLHEQRLKEKIIDRVNIAHAGGIDRR
jgi:hypothetical protein